MAVKIECAPNGPYIVTGEIELRGPGGDMINPGGNKIALCRCGGSTRKPFCDGTHSKIGFNAAEAAVAREHRKA
ncbi:MAG TPA: CDGSH iron-sulfur domain-containing protein [Nitrospirales bacterium]|nr:CDGSH iron-sulfur domain-containing protein [Nitrospirales bacterium]